MKVFITGSQKSGSSSLTWLLSQSFQDHAVETLVAGKCDSGRLKNVFGLSEVDTPSLKADQMSSSPVGFYADELKDVALPLDAANKQRIVILDDSCNTADFVNNLTTENDNQIVIVPTFGEEINGADMVVCVVEPTAQSVATYEKVRKACVASNTPFAMVFNKFDANNVKPVFADATASISNDDAIAKHWWVGVSAKNRRQMTRLVTKIKETQTVSAK